MLANIGEQCMKNKNFNKEQKYFLQNNWTKNSVDGVQTIKWKKGSADHKSNGMHLRSKKEKKT